MRYIIFDLEATCDKQNFPPERMETIEIGAVTLEWADSFTAFVRPVSTFALSAFCTDLTGITQSEVDAAEPFYTVFPRFAAWCEAGNEPFTLCSWGAYDIKQLRLDCERHKMTFPANFDRHINLKRAFGEKFGTRPLGMMRALERLKLPAQGQHHRAIDDARNIARIAERLLPLPEIHHD